MGGGGGGFLPLSPVCLSSSSSSWPPPWRDSRREEAEGDSCGQTYRRRIPEAEATQPHVRQRFLTAAHDKRERKADPKVVTPCPLLFLLKARSKKSFPRLFFRYLSPSILALLLSPLCTMGIRYNRLEKEERGGGGGGSSEESSLEIPPSIFSPSFFLSFCWQ